jgi:sortase A
MTSVRRPLRAFSTVLIIAGVLMLADAGLTVAWQEPVSGIYARIVQGQLGGDLHRLELQRPSAVELAALARIQDQGRRMAFLARRLRATAKPGDAVGRIRIPRIGANFVVVNGTDTGSLRKGPGIYNQVPFPGAPGTTAIAGHRTTYLAPFRNIDQLRPGNTITVEMPYGRFTYVVSQTKIVPPTEVSVIRRVAFDRLVLSACHPLYSAAKRIVVFARLRSAEARGAAV